jgi:hypothetical protein
VSVAWKHSLLIQLCAGCYTVVLLTLRNDIIRYLWLMRGMPSNPSCTCSREGPNVRVNQLDSYICKHINLTACPPCTRAEQQIKDGHKIDYASMCVLQSQIDMHRSEARVCAIDVI